jgi:hypothetical protein
MKNIQKRTNQKPSGRWKRAGAIVSGAIAAVGVVASLIPFVHTAGLLKTVVPMICGASILAGFIFLDEFIKSFRSLHLVKSAEYLGIGSISRSGNAHELIIKHKYSITELRIMMYSGVGLKPLLDNGYLKKIVVEGKADVKILLATPDSKFVRENEDIEGEAGRISRGIEQTRISIERVQKEVAEAGKQGTVGSITVRYYNTQIRSAITLINNEIGFLTLSLAPFFGSNTASFELFNIGSESLFTRCSGHFNAVWERARKGISRRGAMH